MDTKRCGRRRQYYLRVQWADASCVAAVEIRCRIQWDECSGHLEDWRYRVVHNGGEGNVSVFHLVSSPTSSPLIMYTALRTAFRARAQRLSANYQRLRRLRLGYPSCRAHTATHRRLLKQRTASNTAQRVRLELLRLLGTTFLSISPSHTHLAMLVILRCSLH